MGDVKSATGWTCDASMLWLRVLLLVLHDGCCTLSAIELEVVSQYLKDSDEVSKEGKGEDMKDFEGD